MNGQVAAAEALPLYADVPISGGIVRHPSAQPRVELSSETIARYAEAVQAGAKFPPVVLFYDEAEKKHYLADGFHRMAAYEAAGRQDIPAEIHIGDLRDAILYSVSANAAHGLQRTDDDKRRAVKQLLTDTEWSQWSDRAIATRAGVSHTFVGKIREELEPKPGNEPEQAKPTKAKKPSRKRKVKRGSQEYEMETAGRKKEPEEKPKIADPRDALALAKELGKETPAVVVATVVGFSVACSKILPSPENAAQLLKTRGVEVSPQTLVNIARFYEGLAFALDQ